MGKEVMQKKILYCEGDTVKSLTFNKYIQILIKNLLLLKTLILLHKRNIPSFKEYGEETRLLDVGDCILNISDLRE